MNFKLDNIIFPEISFEVIKQNLSLGKELMLPEIIVRKTGHHKEGGLVELEIKCESTESVPEAAFKIQALMVIFLTEIEPGSDEELNAFIETSAIFISWPYWREFLSSIVKRTGLPDLLLPLLPAKDKTDRVVLFSPDGEEEKKRIKRE